MLIVVATFVGVSAMAEIVAAWDFSTNRLGAATTPGWTSVDDSAVTDGIGSTVNGINIKLTSGLIEDQVSQIDAFVNFVEDGTPLLSVSSIDVLDQRVYEDFFANVRLGNPKYLLSGLTAGQEYAIQVLGHFGDTEQISVVQDGISQSPIQLAGNATAGDVVYSVHYSFIATVADTDVEFAFDGVTAGNVSDYGIAGLVVEAIPEPATLGMVAVAAGALLFIRRRLRIYIAS